MTDLSFFLIAHKVRGSAAFDIAERMPCPLCAGHGHDLDGVCHECRGERVWWIIPTSGHRAYPYFFSPLDDLGEGWMPRTILDSMPSDLRDHYAANTESRPRHTFPKKSPPDLNSILGMLP